MAKIVLEIENCKGCPHIETKRLYTEDSWEMAYDWFCAKKGMELIQSYVEWHEESKIKIPDWCPCSLDTK